MMETVKYIFYPRKTVLRAIDHVLERRTRFVISFIIYWFAITAYIMIAFLLSSYVYLPSDLPNFLGFIIQIIMMSFILVIFTVISGVLTLAYLPVLLTLYDLTFLEWVFIASIYAFFGVVYYLLSVKVPVDSPPGEMMEKAQDIVKKLALIPVESFLVFTIGIFIMACLYVTVIPIPPDYEIYLNIEIMKLPILLVLGYYTVLGSIWLDERGFIPKMPLDKRRAKEQEWSNIAGNIMTTDQMLNDRLYKLQTVKKTAIGPVSYSKLLEMLGFRTIDELEVFLNKINGNQLGYYRFSFSVDKNRQMVSFQGG